jgi:uncharacterized protein
MMAQDVAIGLVSAILIVMGGLGSLLPVLPGTPLSFGGLWLWAWHTNYETITPTVLLVFGILTALTFVIDFFAPALGAKGYKATRYGVIGSMLGAFLGVFVMGPIGIILGPFIGGFLGEILASKGYEHATRVAWGSFVGLVIGALFKLALVMAMLVYFIYSLF